MRSHSTPRRSLSLLVAGTVLTGSAIALAQEAPPPMTVPTDPVSQSWTAPPTGDAVKPPPPKPVPTPATPGAPVSAPGSGGDGGGGGGGGGSAAPAGSSAPAPQVQINNEGVFKLSGTKGSGWVGGPRAPKSKPVATGAPTRSTSSGTGKAAASHYAAPAKSAPVAEWPGFQMTSDGGSEVMVEFSKSPTAPTEHAAAGSYEYVFKGAYVKKGNSKNPLLTAFFNTPVSNAHLKQVGADVHLIIELRAGASATPMTSTRASADAGGQQFVVKFPSGSWLPAGGVADAKPVSASSDDAKPAKSSGAKGGGGKRHGKSKSAE